MKSVPFWQTPQSPSKRNSGRESDFKFTRIYPQGYIRSAKLSSYEPARSAAISGGIYTHKVKLRIVGLSALLAASVGVVALGGVSANADPMTPRIYGGTSAAGNPGVAALAIFDGASWSKSCSAVVWKPRVLLTSGHCVTLEGSATRVPRLAIFPPGGAAVQFSNTGPQGASPANVIGIWTPSTYVNASMRVEPNDFAVLLLDQDLGPSMYSRLATAAEMTRWAATLYPGTIAGYGLKAPNQRDVLPLSATVPIDTYAPNTSAGPVFSVTQNASVGVCSGDSGGPTYATNAAGENLVLGVNSGSAGGCIAGFTGTYLMIGFSAIDYLDLVNQALVGAGYPTIPSAPTNIAVSAVNNSVVVSWQPPTTSPQTVVGYDVIDPLGTPVCTSATLTCTVPNLPDGDHSFSVRTRNAQGEGNALPASVTTTTKTPTQLAPPRATKKKITFTTLAGATSAVVNQYRVIDVKGKRICSIKDFNPGATSLTCPTPTKAGIYRFRVLAVTQMGQTPPSGLSVKVRVS